MIGVIDSQKTLIFVARVRLAWMGKSACEASSPSQTADRAMVLLPVPIELRGHMIHIHEAGNAPGRSTHIETVIAECRRLGSLVASSASHHCRSC